MDVVGLLAPKAISFSAFTRARVLLASLAPMMIVLGIQKTNVTGGEDRFAMQLVEDRDSSAGKVYCAVTVEDLTEELIRRLGAARLLTPADLEGYLNIRQTTLGRPRLAWASPRPRRTGAANTSAAD